MRVIVDRSKCVGGGNCVRSAPAVFGQDDENGLVILLQEQPPESEKAGVEEAVDLCPVHAIDIAN